MLAVQSKSHLVVLKIWCAEDRHEGDELQYNAVPQHGTSHSEGDRESNHDSYRMLLGLIFGQRKGVSRIELSMINV